MKEQNEKKITLKDIVETLFILSRGRELVSFFVEPKQRAERLARAQKLAEKTPEFFREYLKVLANTSFDDEYNKQLTEFAFTLQNVNIQQVVKDIDRYLTLCLSGFASIPKQEGAQKKN